MIKSSQSIRVEDDSIQYQLSSPQGPQISLRNTFGINIQDSLPSLESEGCLRMDGNFKMKEKLKSISFNSNSQIKLTNTLTAQNPIQKLHQLAAKNRLVKQFKQNILMSSYILSKEYKEKVLSFQGFYCNKNNSLNSSFNRGQNYYLPVFDAFSNAMKIWDFVMIYQHLVQLWFLPFYISFYRLNFNLTLLKEIIVATIITNSVIQMNRQIIYKGEYIQNREKIVKIYLRFGILSDAIQLVTWVCFIYLEEQLYNMVYMIALGFLLAFCCIHRLKKITEFYLDSFYNKGNLSNMIDLLILILQIYFVAHYMACIWHFVGDIGNQVLDSSWLEKYELIDRSTITRYNYSFYWATMTMTTVGYGDITGSNNYEVLISNIMMFFSSCIFAYSMNSIGNILKSINDNKLYFRRTISAINTYMQKNEVDLAIQSKVRNYIKYISQSESQDNINDSANIIKQLPNGLKDGMRVDISQKIIKKIKLLQQHFSYSTLRTMTDYLSITTYAPGEFIYHQNEQMECLYFINSGEVQFNEEKSQAVLFRLKQNQTFNEFSFFTQQSTKSNAVSVTFSQIIKIDRSQFLSIIKDCQRDLEQFYNIKDTIILSCDYSILQKKCNYCGKMKHETINCPLLTFQPDRIRCIKRYNRSLLVSQNRKFTQRHYHYIPARNRYLEIKNSILQSREYQIVDQLQSEVNLKDEINLQDAISAEKQQKDDFEILALRPKTSPIKLESNTNLRRPSKFSIPLCIGTDIKSLSKSQLDQFLASNVNFQIDKYFNYENYMIDHNLSDIIKKSSKFKRKAKKVSARKIFLKDSHNKKTQIANINLDSN